MQRFHDHSRANDLGVKDAARLLRTDGPQTRHHSLAIDQSDGFNSLVARMIVALKLWMVGVEGPHKQTLKILKNFAPARQVTEDPHR